MRSKSYFFLLIVLALGILSGIVYSTRPYKLGLDVRGGIRLVYQMQLKPEEQKQADSIRNRLINVLERRAQGPMAVAEPTIVAKGTDQIQVELPEATDIEAAKKVIGTSAKIEFYHARNVVTEQSPSREYTIAGQDKGTDPTVAFAKTSDPTKVIEPTIVDPSTKQERPNPEYAQIIAGWGPPILEGTDLQDARPSPAGNGVQPYMTFSREGAQKMEKWSRAWYNKRENIAAVLDGRVLSIAAVQANTVLKDNALITGQFEDKYVRDLCELLNGGSLPVKLDLLSAEKVDPTIGNFALDKMVMAGFIAFGAMAVFLLAYYAFPGFVALLALGLYVLFTLTILKTMGATFSLASIAGFILSVGMAVDANVLVFERLKEEMKSGKSLTSAIELGFKRAFPAILDSNACTILTSLVLLALGTGPVRGFATTLIVGVLISLFTAVTITRSLLVFFAGSGIAANPKWYAPKRSWFGEKFEDKAEEHPFRIVETYKKWFLISALSMAIPAVFFFMGGFKLNVEFRGGYELVYPAPAGISSTDVMSKLEAAGLQGANVKLGEAGTERRLYVSLPTSDKITSDAQASTLVAEAAGLTNVDQSKVSYTSIGPTIQRETTINAIKAVVISALMIMIYLAFRFGAGAGGFVAGLRFGGAAIGALLHDAVVVVCSAAVLGFFFKWEISALFLTAMLTVIGFSVHDTIVIFDRIRENLHRQRQGEDFGHLIDRSITQSFARSINTSMTVVVTLIILLAIGTATPDLKLFAAAMLIGIASGTYSSIYNASPILYLWDRAIAKKHGEENSLVGLAKRDAAQNRVITTTSAAPAQVVNPTSGRSYGQVKRRASSDNQKGHIELDD